MMEDLFLLKSKCQSGNNVRYVKGVNYGDGLQKGQKIDLTSAAAGLSELIIKKLGPRRAVGGGFP